jgi:hypothetical protein
MDYCIWNYTRIIYWKVFITGGLYLLQVCNGYKVVMVVGDIPLGLV